MYVHDIDVHDIDVHDIDVHDIDVHDIDVHDIDSLLGEYGGYSKLSMCTFRRLQCDEAIIIVNCSFAEEVGPLTGTKIETNNDIGVIIGNCITKSCQKGNCTEDPIAEMLFPADIFGTQYIVFDLHSMGADSDLVMMVPMSGTRVRAVLTQGTDQ
uniref:IgGFc-binding protein N-terminal domain-containing protein n=1 Tax=Biomphalaria glabrata TaxID=6526 RepID=A0A2C9KZ41_BIOGL